MSYCHDAAGCFNIESERVGFNENDTAQVLVASEDATLNTSTVSDGLIRVDTLGRLLSEVPLEELLDLGDTSRTTDKDDLRNVLAKPTTTGHELGTYLANILLLLGTSVSENPLDRIHGLPEQVHVQFLAPRSTSPPASKDSI